MVELEDSFVTELVFLVETVSVLRYVRLTLCVRVLGYEFVISEISVITCVLRAKGELVA